MTLETLGQQRSLLAGGGCVLKKILMLQQYAIRSGPFFEPQINTRLPLNLNYLISSVSFAFYFSSKGERFKSTKTFFAEKRTLIKHLFRKSNKVVRYTTS